LVRFVARGEVELAEEEPVAFVAAEDPPPAREWVGFRAVGPRGEHGEGSIEQATDAAGNDGAAKDLVEGLGTDQLAAAEERADERGRRRWAAVAGGRTARKASQRPRNGWARSAR